MSACEDKKSEDVDDPNFDTPDWTDESHSKSGEPNYEIVYPVDKVNRIDVVISKKNWEKMIDDMTEKWGPFGQGGQKPGNFADENPIWVPCDFFFEKKQWYKVGIRFKGNSTLGFAWHRGKWNGFKQFSMSSNAMDPSLIREKVSADIFRDAGVPAAHTAFYRVYLDHGDGPQFWGIYTCVEEVDDTVIETQFISDNGNLYKPEGRGATFAKGSFSEASFAKKTNEDDSDWNDILAMFDALHSDNRISDPDAWRNELESIFQTDIFLMWLATNTTIQNWDSYGKMSQNYYLYNDPETSKLSWITWDHNETLQHGKAGGALSIGLSEVRDDWPLIRFLMDNETYQKQYKTNLRSVIDGPFNMEKMISIYQKYHDLIRPYIARTNNDNSDPEVSPQQLDRGLSELIDHVKSRHGIVNSYIN